MAKTVADQFAETLATAGIKRIYGIVGDSLNGLTDAIRRQGKIEWVHVRHEEVAAFAAGAQAHLTGELAVCAGSCGPGNLHLINGLFDCHRSRVPVLGIAAQIPSAEIGGGYFQETHPQNQHRVGSRPCILREASCSLLCVLSAEGQGRRSRAAVRGSALPQKADQPLLQSIISSVPHPDIDGANPPRDARSGRAARESSQPIWRVHFGTRSPHVSEGKRFAGSQAYSLIVSSLSFIDLG